MSSVNESNSKICHSCGKVVRVSRKGTMTDWIFGGSNCQCGQAVVSQSNVDSTEQPSAISALTPGDHVPDLGEGLEVLSFLGEGGMGTVWKALDKRRNKIYAVKVLRHELSMDDAAVKRFEREVDAASQLTHPNLVFVYGAYRTTDGKPYMVMNYVDGTSLSELLTHGAVPFERALPIFEQVAQALAHAHEQGIVHRDLKPSNILLYEHKTQSDLVRLVDFGIAKIMSTGVNTTDSLTQTGDLFGSPLYMSPEQCSGDELDARSDIYSLGCVMYQTLSGEPPFNDSNAIKTMMAHVQTPPPTLRAAKSFGIPKKLETVVMRCMQKKAGDRYQTAGALARDLEAVKNDGALSRETALPKLRLSPLYLKVGVIVFCSFAVGVFCCWMVLNAKVDHNVTLGKLSRTSDATSVAASELAAVQPYRSQHQEIAKVTAKVTPPDETRFTVKPEPIPSPTSDQVSGKNFTAAAPVISPASGGQIILEAIAKHRNVVRLPGFPFLNKDFEQLRGNTLVTDVDCGLTGSGNEVMEILASLPNLRVLELYGNRFTSAGLKYLRQMKKLEVLNLSATAINDENMKYLADLKSLKTLKISHNPVTDKGFSFIAGLKSLNKLDVSDTQITDKSLGAVISQFPDLHELSLATDKVTGAGLVHLCANTKMTSLNLHGCNPIDNSDLHLLVHRLKLTRFSSPMDFTDEQTKILAEKPGWQILVLDGQMTGQSFIYLINQKELLKLVILGNARTAKEGLIFQRAHRDCIMEAAPAETPKSVEIIRFTGKGGGLRLL